MKLRARGGRIPGDPADSWAYVDTHRSRQRTPVEALALAAIGQAFRDLKLFYVPIVVTKRRGRVADGNVVRNARKSAVMWIFGRARDFDYPFESCCIATGLDADYLRRLARVFIAKHSGLGLF